MVGLRRLREQALTLQKLIGLSDLYAYIRRTESASNRRTAALDQLAARMQAAGREGQFDPAEVSIWFHEGTNALRVVALNLMLARAECRDFLAVLKAVDEPRSLLEQFCGLLLADAIGRAQRKRRFRRGPPLMSLSNMILSELEIT